MSTLEETKVLTLPFIIAMESSVSTGDQQYVWGYPIPPPALGGPSSPGNKSPPISYIHGLPNPCDSCRRKVQFHAKLCWKDRFWVLLFWWTPHRLVAVDGVDAFHPGLALLFVAVENQIHEEDPVWHAKKGPWWEGNNDHVVSVYLSTREMNSMWFRIWDFILLSSFLILSLSNILQIDFTSTGSFGQIYLITALISISRTASLSLLLLVF